MQRGLCRLAPRPCAGTQPRAHIPSVSMAWKEQHKAHSVDQKNDAPPDAPGVNHRLPPLPVDVLFLRPFSAGQRRINCNNIGRNLLTALLQQNKLVRPSAVALNQRPGRSGPHCTGRDSGWRPPNFLFLLLFRHWLLSRGGGTQDWSVPTS